MKIRATIIFSLFVIILIGFIPIKKTNDIVINSDYFSVYKYFTTAEDWQLWQPELKIGATHSQLKRTGNLSNFSLTVPGTSFHVKKVWLNDISIRETKNNNVSDFNCIIVPEPKSNHAIIVVTREQELWKLLHSMFFQDDLRGSPIVDLKNYMEDINSFYGFNIQREFSNRSIFIVNKKTIAKKDIYQHCAPMLDELNCFVSKNRLTDFPPFLLQRIDFGKDSLQILIGLRINKNPPLSNKLDLMIIPAGRVLVGPFKGRYIDRVRLYTAMENYMNDKSLKPILLPLEEFKNDKLPVSDTTIVDMDIISPYF